MTGSRAEATGGGPGEALRAVVSALGQTMRHFSVMVAANITGALLSIPLVLLLALGAFALRSYVVFSLGVMLFVAVLPNPALCGLQFAAHELAHNEFLALSDLWTGLREYWRAALTAWLVSLLGSGLILLNLEFYVNQAGSPHAVLHGAAGPLTIPWLVGLGFWLALHLYVFPLLFAQEVRRLRTTYRNALVILLSRPIFTAMVTVLWLLILFVTSFTGLTAVIGLAFGAVIQQNALTRILPSFEGQNRPAAE